MINSFRQAIRFFWPQRLTNWGTQARIFSDATSMSKDAIREEALLFPAHQAEDEEPTRLQVPVSPLRKAHKSVTVVSACILRNGGQEILLSMRRAPGIPGLDGKWELPGGKIEFGETPEQAIVREIGEELGFSVRPTRLLPYLHTNLWEYPDAMQHVVLACYECEMDEQADYEVPAANAEWFHINQIDFGSTLPGTREFASLAAQNDWFDRVYIEFESYDRSTNAQKCFALATQSTLFSKYGLVKYSWRGAGANRRTKRKEFQSPRELDNQIFETTKRRLAEGYHIRALKGPDRHPEVLSRVRDLAEQFNRHTSAFGCM